MKKEFAGCERQFTREYMEMRSRENQNRVQNLDEYYRSLNEYIKEHQSTDIIQDDNKSEYDDYLRRYKRTRELTINRF